MYYKVAYIDNALRVHAKSYNYREDAIKAFNAIRRILPDAPIRTESPDNTKYYGTEPDAGWDYYLAQRVCVWKYYTNANMEKFTGEYIFPCEFLDVVQTYRHADGFGTDWVLVIHDMDYEPISTCYIP